MLTGVLYTDAFENLHAVWKWPSNNRKTISAFLIFLLHSQMDFAVLLDTVPFPLNHLMWWKLLGPLISSSDWVFLTSPSNGKKKNPNNPIPSKTTTQPKKCPMLRGRGLILCDPSSKDRSAAVWLLQNARCDPGMIKAFLPGSVLEQSREFCWVGMKKSDQKVLATESWHNR